jgi:type II secretion system protein C
MLADMKKPRVFESSAMGGSCLETRIQTRAGARRRWAIRGLVFGLCAVVGFLALWSSGFTLQGWRRSIETIRPAVPLPVPASQPGAANAPKALDPALAFPGIMSSTSDSPRRLILTGTILGRNSREGSAFVGIDARNPQTYVAGALLANGARLAQIFKDYVVLEHDDRSVRLYVQGHHPSGTTQPSDELVMVGKSESFKPAQPTSTETFTDVIRPSPVYEGSTLEGYQVYPGVHAGAFARMGLLPGDVITQIDGMPFSDPSQAMAMFSQLASGTTMTATVNRKGTLQQVALDGSFIVSEHAQAKSESPSAPTS